MLAIISADDLIKVLATSTNQSNEKHKFLQRCDTIFCRLKKEICAVYVDFVDEINTTTSKAERCKQQQRCRG